MKKSLSLHNGTAITILLFISCQTAANKHGAQTPVWVYDLEKAFPDRDWVRVRASGSSQDLAEQAAMNSLARYFRTDVDGLIQTSETFSQIINDAGGKKTVSFEQSQDFLQKVNITTNIRGLIMVQTEQYRAADGTFHVNARMHRRECAERYAAMIRENTAVINNLLAFANSLSAGFEAYQALSLAAGLAEVTDNFQNILQILDSTAINRQPDYGGVNAIKAKLRQVAGAFTVGIALATMDGNDAVPIRRAIASFLNEKGFRTNEQGQGKYMLRANARFEPIAFPSGLHACYYYFDAALEDSSGVAIFTFPSESERRNDYNAQRAKQMALEAVELSARKGKFAEAFDAWLGSLIE